MMKKIIILVLILIMVLNFSGIAFAETTETAPADPEVSGGIISQLLTEGFNTFMQNLVTDLLNKGLSFLKDNLFTTQDITQETGLVSIHKDIKGVVNSLFVLVLIIGSIMFYTSDFIGSSMYEVRIYLTRIIWGFIAANISLYICSWIIQLNNGLVEGVLAGGISGKNLEGFSIISTSNAAGVPPLSVLVLALVVAIMALILGCIYIIRAAILWLLIILSPIVFLLWVLPQTQSWTRLWTQMFSSVVFLQFIHALMLFIFLKLRFEGSGYEGIVGVAIFFLMIVVPGYILNLAVLQGSINRFSSLGRQGTGFTGVVQEVGRGKK